MTEADLRFKILLFNNIWNSLWDHNCLHIPLSIPDAMQHSLWSHKCDHILATVKLNWKMNKRSKQLTETIKSYSRQYLVGGKRTFTSTHPEGTRNKRLSKHTKSLLKQDSRVMIFQNLPKQRQNLNGLVWWSVCLWPWGKLRSSTIHPLTQSLERLGPRGSL